MSDIVEQLLKANQAAVLLNVSVYRLYQLARADLVPSVRLGRSYRFSKNALRAFIDSGGKAWDESGRRNCDPSGAEESPAQRIRRLLRQHATRQATSESRGAQPAR